MAPFSRLSILFTFCMIAFLVISKASSASGELDFNGGSQLGLMMPKNGSGGCRGTVAECMIAGGNAEEFELDSESSRRILATTNYISYAALQRNTIPCSVRGQSYYNCQAGSAVNPYTRGCSAITRCRS